VGYSTVLYVVLEQVVYLLRVKLTKALPIAAEQYSTSTVLQSKMVVRVLVSSSWSRVDSLEVAR